MHIRLRARKCAFFLWGVFGFLFLLNGAFAAPIKVLTVGDSHTVQSYGRLLHQHLNSHSKITNATYGSCGSAPRHWFSGWVTPCGWYQGYIDGTWKKGKKRKTPLLVKLLEDIDSEHHGPSLGGETWSPDWVVIGLGANLLRILKTPEQKNKARLRIRKFIDAVQEVGARCIWVGPTDGSPKKKPKAKQDNLYQVLEDAVGDRCIFISSRESSLPFMKYPKNCYKDGGHWDACPEGKKLAARWASTIAARVVEIIGIGSE